MRHNTKLTQLLLICTQYVSCVGLELNNFLNLTLNVLSKLGPGWAGLGLGGSSGRYGFHRKISHASLRACGAQLRGD